MSGKLSTKDKILEAVIMLFNNNGIKNVRLQHIADSVGISVGNLAYHFPDKKHILLGLEKKIGEEVVNQSRSWKTSFHLIDFDNRLIQLYHFINKYSFYFLDALEIQRSYPSIHRKRLNFILSLLKGISKWLQVNRDHDFINLSQENDADKTAEMIWFISAFWLTKNKILNKTDEHEIAFREAVWAQIKPYFTEKAQIEFEALILPKLYY